MAYNHLKEVMKNKSDDELLEVLKSEDEYQPEAITFAKNELEKRKIKISKTSIPQTEPKLKEESFYEIEQKLNLEEKGYKKQEPIAPKEFTGKGFGGWLLYPFAYIILAFLGFIFNLIINIAIIYNLINLGFLNSILFYIFFAISNLLLVIFTGFVILNFLQQKKSAPKYFITWLALIFLINITSYLLASFTNIFEQVLQEEDIYAYYKATAKSLFHLIVIGMYFLNSKRVKNTFIN